MAGKYWIKLYHEILDDPKMGKLDDRLYRRTIQLFLLAGVIDEDGLLPPIADIAWRLRADEESLETEMIELQKVGILSVQDGKWIVTKFSERQAPMDKAEYMRRLRDEKQRQKYYQPRYQDVTGSHADKIREDIDTDIDKEEEKEEEESPPPPNLFVVYEKNIGPITQNTSERLKHLEKEHGEAVVIDAIKEADEYNARSLKYVETVLDSWKKNGRKSKSKSKRDRVVDDSPERRRKYAEDLAKYQ